MVDDLNCVTKCKCGTPFLINTDFLGQFIACNKCHETFRITEIDVNDEITILENLCVRLNDKIKLLVKKTHEITNQINSSNFNFKILKYLTPIKNICLNNLILFTGSIICIPAFITIATCIICDYLEINISMTIFSTTASFMLASIISFALWFCIHRIPNTALDSLQVNINNLNHTKDNIKKNIDNLNGNYIKCYNRLYRLIAVSTHNDKLANLCKENWKAMRGPELESFLERVFLAHGCIVMRTGKSGDHGIDLIVEINGYRIGIQVKGYQHSVNNSAVQEAHTGIKMHNCNICAVITNSRFTKSAIETASVVGCRLIDENSMVNFITGDMSHLI